MSYKILPLGKMFLVWAVYASLSPASLASLILLDFTSNGPQAHKFIPTTALRNSLPVTNHVEGAMPAGRITIFVFSEINNIK